MTKIGLESIIDELELISDDGNSILHKPTGQLHHFTDEKLEEAFYQAESNGTLQMIRADDCIRLPCREEIDEPGVLLRFCMGITDETVRSTLLDSLRHADPALREFREILERHHMGDQWYAFKREAFRRTAIEWCERHKIEFS